MKRALNYMVQENVFSTVRNLVNTIIYIIDTKNSISSKVLWSVNDAIVSIEREKFEIDVCVNDNLI